MAEKKLNILSAETHFDDAGFLWVGKLAQWIRAGHNVDSIVFTNSNAQKMSDLRMKEQRKMMDLVGMNNLYPVGTEYNFPDGGLSLNYLAPMTQAFTYVLDQAVSVGKPYDVIVSFGPDAATGHPDHFVTWQVIDKVFRECADYFQNWQQFWQVGLSPLQRESWLPYFVSIPKIDISKYVGVDITEELPLKISAVKVHESQLLTGGHRHIERLRKEKPPMEYFRVFTRTK